MVSVQPVDFDVDVRKVSRESRRGAPLPNQLSADGRRRPSRLAKVRRVLTPILDSIVYKVALGCAILFALFAGSLWVLFDVPDDPGNQVLDALMLTVFAFFVIDVVLTSIVEMREYPMSFFFTMDVLGTLSIAFEVSFLLGTTGKPVVGAANINTVWLRMARVAQVGNRVSQATKILRHGLLGRGRPPEKKAGGVREAKVVSQRLVHTLASRVSLISILLVLLVPLFSMGQYPKEDLSMKQWAIRLEEAYRQSCLEARSRTSSETFQVVVRKMARFYDTINYRPFLVEGFDEEVSLGNWTARIPGASVLQGVRPVRQQCIFRQEVPACLQPRPGCSESRRAAVSFDFRAPKQLEAATELALIVFVVAVMVAMTFDLSNTMMSMVVLPLERMLGMVKSTAANLLQQFGLHDELDGDDEERDAAEETELVEIIFKKLARLATIATAPAEATEAALAGMDDGERGVIVDIMAMQVHGDSGVPSRKLSSIESVSSYCSGMSGNNIEDIVVRSLPFAVKLIESWDFDVLTLDVESQTKAVLYIFFDSTLGPKCGRSWTSVQTFKQFHDVVRVGYNDLPYHCYSHACDVLHTVFRLLTLTSCDRWLSDIDAYALLVASLCHDLGHQGRTNPFLMETRHELALLYNDKSPLENMHCARLFEICNDRATNIFDQADISEQKQARKVCIAAILHTDNANHFEMVKDITKVYELLSEVCDQQGQQAQQAHGHLLPAYLEQVLEKNTLLWLELLLHLADVSNPLKPFPICKKWAWRVLDEFFDQGDEEKELGIPVGMLNDRDKVNRPGSQHGFISFLVAPLVTMSVRLFPTLHMLSTQMAANLEAWRDLWVEEAHPSPEDVARRDADVQRIKDVATQLRRAA